MSRPVLVRHPGPCAFALLLVARVPLWVLGGDETDPRPFDRRLIDAVVKGGEDPEPLVRERPRDAFELFHVYLDAGVLGRADGNEEMESFARRFGETLAPAYDRVMRCGENGLVRAAERYAAIQADPERLRALAAAIRHMRTADEAERQRDGARAVVAAEKALELYRSAGEPRGQARALQLLGGRRERPRELETAVAELGESSRLYLRAGDMWNRPIALAQLASYLQGAERYDEALEPAREALEGFERTGREDPAADMRLRLAAMLAKLERHREALPLFRRCAEHFRRPDQLAMRASVLSMEARSLMVLGEYGEGIRLLLAAHRTVADRPEHARTAAWLLYDLAGAYDEIGLHDEAEARVAQVLEKIETQPELTGCCHGLLARIALDRGEPARAETHARKALQHADPESIDSFEYRRLLALSRLHQGDGAGIGELGAARDGCRAAGYRLGAALATVDLGEALHRFARSEEAERAYRDALDDAGVYPEVAWRCHAGLGLLLEEAGERDRAREAYLRAIEIEEHLLARLRAPKLQAGFFERRERPYHRLVELEASLGNARGALEIAERRQARAAAWHFAGAGRARPPAGAPAELVAAREALAGELESIRAALDRASEGAREQELLSRRDALRREYEDLLVQVDLAAPGRSEAAGAFRPADIERVRERLARLDGGAALLVYCVTPEAVHAWCIAGTSAARADLIHRRLPLCESDLRDRIEALRRPFADFRGGTADLTHLAFDTDAAGALYRDLVAPFAEELGESAHLVVVPDGPLHHLPFEALVTWGRRGRIDHHRLFAEYRDCRYVADRWAVSYLPSLRLAERLGGDGWDPDARLLVLADPGSPDGSPPAAPSAARLRGRRREPLPSARAEAVTIEELMGPGRVRRLAGEGATEMALVEGLSDSDIVHLAAHAWVDDEAPLFSGIEMASPETGATVEMVGEAASLDAHEVLALDLRGKLVVLSACETATGKLRRGEGLDSLARAFLFAGARGVVASHWRVDDSAAHLMEAFYRAIRGGASPPVALQRAKVHLLRAKEGKGYVYALPYFWAPFTLAGWCEP